MRLGICAKITDGAMLKEAGWDYVEEQVVRFLRGEDEQWEVPARGVLPVEAGNLMLPPTIKVVGDAVDSAKIKVYMARVMERAQAVGMKTIVFGSGGARRVPEGFSREKAKGQILDFARMIAELAERHGVTVALEHLQQTECNILTSVAEATEYVREVGHGHFRQLVDSYHLWQEKESLESVKSAIPFLSHVHVADVGSRCAPGQGVEQATGMYREFFRVLKAGGYDGRISVEAKWTPGPEVDAEKVAKWVREIWDAS
ncbi:MAG: sugar phosphate isomerase/epimerase [Phycisphaerales bacterium]|nr:sugar phosphate isomerase/epimerase [Phycisphaerales bacterium]